MSDGGIGALRIAYILIGNLGFFNNLFVIVVFIGFVSTKNRVSH